MRGNVTEMPHSNGEHRHASAAAGSIFGHEQYRRLAEFRYVLRKFLHASKIAAGGAGMHTQQYQLLQAVAGMPEDMSPTIAAVAQRLCLRHNSAVELVNRTIEQGLLKKCPDPIDHRRLLLQMTPMGEQVLASLVEFHLRELEELGPDLIKSLKRVLSMRMEARDHRHNVEHDEAELAVHAAGH